MQPKTILPFLTIIFQLLFVPCLSNAGILRQNPLSLAIQLFDKEKYQEAEQLFKELLISRPDDFMVNYFYGACRTENGHYSDQDLAYLLKASKEVNPLNIDYYFAVQYHAKNQWEKASAYYKLYKTVSSENEQEKVGLALKMEQCANHVNPFVSSDLVEKKEVSEVPVVVATGAAAVSSESVERIGENQMLVPTAVRDSVSTKTEETDDEIEDQEVLAEDSTELETAVVPQNSENNLVESQETLPEEEQITFSVNNEITYLTLSNFRTVEGQMYYKEGSEKQSELEKVILRTEILRDKYKNSQSRAEKDSIGQQILDLESQTYELKKTVTQLFLQAKNVENGYWQNASPDETESFIKELNAISLENSNKNSGKTVEVSESPVLIVTPVFMDDEQIKTTTPKEKPSGIVYKIQLGAYSRGIPNTLKPVFSKISVLRKVENYTDENGVVVYTTGNLTKYDDAIEMQKQVKQEGIKDPKIAAYLNGKRITLEQAIEIENRK